MSDVLRELMMGTQVPLFDLRMDAAEEIIRLRNQLPEGMKHCTIVFKECPVGHGELTATNWVEHDCHVCRIRELEAALSAAQGENMRLRRAVADMANSINVVGSPLDRAITAINEAVADIKGRTRRALIDKAPEDVW